MSARSSAARRESVTRTRIFISGLLVEYREHRRTEPQPLQRYADGGDWVLLFNGLVLTAARPETVIPR